MLAYSILDTGFSGSSVTVYMAYMEVVFKTL